MTKEKILEEIRKEAAKKPKDPSAQMIVVGAEMLFDVCNDIKRIADALENLASKHGAS